MPFVHVLKRRTDGAAVVREVFPGPDELCVTGPEGHFYHELHVPFVRRAKQTESSSPQKDAVASLKMGLQALSGKSDRTLPPGSDWLYLKVYCGFATQDEVIDRISDRVVRAAIDMRLIDRWFFIRYADPQHHLRIRFRSAGAAELHQLIPRVTSAVNPFLQSGKAWKIQFDTYEREIERYGGLEGTVAAEELFHADSDAVVEVMKSFGSDGDSDRRWRVALLGIDVLLSDCRLELPDKRDLVKRVRDSLHSRLRLGTGIQHQLGDRFRTERKKLEALLQAADGHDGPIALAAQAFARRSERLAPVVAKLQLLSQKGLLTTGINDLASSYVHMFVNRLIRSSANAHEFVLHDFLFRLYDGQMARAKSHLKERNDSAEAVPCNE